MIKASDFLIPTIIPVFFKLVFRTILLPCSQSKWGYHGTGREAGEHRGHDTSALHKKNSNSAACILISSAACLLCNSELRVFWALYYPFTDENDGAFLTVEGSKWLEVKLKYRNEDCSSGRAGKSFSLSLFQANLGRFFFFFFHFKSEKNLKTYWNFPKISYWNNWSWTLRVSELFSLSQPLGW